VLCLGGGDGLTLRQTRRGRPRSLERTWIWRWGWPAAVSAARRSASSGGACNATVAGLCATRSGRVARLRRGPRWGRLQVGRWQPAPTRRLPATCDCPTPTVSIVCLASRSRQPPVPRPGRRLGVLPSGPGRRPNPSNRPCSQRPLSLSVRHISPGSRHPAYLKIVVSAVRFCP
jgi:hypothetical protein